MTGIQPVPRELTEEQFANMVNGIELSYIEMQALRKSYGLQYDQNFVMLDRYAVTAQYKIIGAKSALLPVS